jgi:tetratricopeptide (TPR) repeat protein
MHDFEGTPNASDSGRPVQVSIWYPAVAGGQRMSIAEYTAISGAAETLAEVRSADLTAAREYVRRSGALVGLQLTEASADSIARLSTAAVHAAPPANGRFPLLLGGMPGAFSAYGLAEYLASHGYVVVTAATVGTASQQVNQVPIAIETHTRDIEVAHSLASSLPFVDAGRFGLLGVNFNGLAVLTHQFRNMGASAVVSIDGYETKAANAAGLRTSPYYLPARMRVPYLSFTQANAPPPFVFKDSLIRELKYSRRYSYVVRGLEHGQLIGNYLPFPIGRELRVSYDFFWTTTRSFLDAWVKRDSAARAFIERSAVENGYPEWVAEVDQRLAELPPIPIPEEFEQIAMSGDTEKLRSILRQARSADSTVSVFSIDALTLFAFRFRQRGDTARAIGLSSLAVEAYPLSAIAVNNLGNTYRDVGDTVRALQHYERALLLLDDDASLSNEDRTASRRVIELKIRQLRGTGGSSPLHAHGELVSRSSFVRNVPREVRAMSDRSHPLRVRLWQATLGLLPGPLIPLASAEAQEPWRTPDNVAAIPRAELDSITT